MARRYTQPSLFGELAFLTRKRKRVKMGSESFVTGKHGKGKAAPLGITLFGQRAARSKVARFRKVI